MHALRLLTAFLSTCYTIALAAAAIQLDAEENPFLNSHNLARSRFGAQPLLWSMTLANKAQSWANGCRFEHTNGTLGPYGENVAAGTGNFSAIDSMNLFMDGLQTFDPINPMFSDFTQIIWQSTTELGCASAQCSGIFDAAFGEATMHVCLYEPVGNVVGALLDNINIGSV